MASPPTTGGHLFSNNVKKCGYLRKQKHGHRRFFVLREHGDCSPARLEYYESEKKWRNKSAAKRVITLDSCLCVNKRADAKHKHLVALYTKDEYFAVAAENEQEQECWYGVLSELIAEGKVFDSPASTSSLVGFEEASYGLIAPATSVYREVWQVNLKSKGLGQSKNLTGIYRLCLSSRTIGFVKINSDVAAVSLQLMNIRRCGHSDSFFFIEVGRSAVTGPGEFWMQAEDSVVAQNIHETILEAMKELSEFRPRSKSQSASTNPISVPTRRNLNNLPPSQTGLVRRSRTDGVAATSPGRKFTSCRTRATSEGDGAVTRPVSMSISLSESPTSPRCGGTHLIRSHTLSNGRTCKMLESSMQHSRSMPVSQSPPAGCSPVSMSPCRGGPAAAANATFTPDFKARRPFSCSASISGSLSGEEYGSSPGDARFHPLTRSDTPDSLCSTPPPSSLSSSRDAGELLCGYMMMAAEGPGGAQDKAYRKRTYSLTTPRQPRPAATPLASASLDEYTMMRMAAAAHRSASPKVSYPEDYGAVAVGASPTPLRSHDHGNRDEGYMPMTPGAASVAGTDDYVPTSPMCVSAPKLIVNPRAHAQSLDTGRCSPGSGSLEDRGYMRMWCGSRGSMDSTDGRSGEYMNMSPGNPPPTLQTTPPDYYQGPSPQPGAVAPARATRQAISRTPGVSEESDHNNNHNTSQYVLMSPQSQRPQGGEADYYAVMQPAQSSPAASPAHRGRPEGSLAYRARPGRPNRLALDTLRTMPSMNEDPAPGEPRSPGEYIDIDFGGCKGSPRCLASPESGASSLGSSGGGGTQQRSPLSDYMNLRPGGSSSPKEAAEAGLACPDELPEASMCPFQEGGHAESDYTEMTFDLSGSPRQPVRQTASAVPGGSERSLSMEDQRLPEGLGAFLLDAAPPSDPDGAAKVIRANPQGRRRHSSETFSSTATVTPVPPSFATAAADGLKRHSSVENVSSRSSEGSDEEGGSPPRRPVAVASGHGGYIALNLLEKKPGAPEKHKDIGGFKPANSCKGGASGLRAPSYVCLVFKEATTTAQGKVFIYVDEFRRSIFTMVMVNIGDAS
ncbi:hypothetical protein NHX12_014747 [Muraenolepis orangiensis]|uniref:Insulin receptor substrate 2 n=1 Tax=Muraenolepis orangiensis TaxID=630683 RepID=A0A9Q0DAP8_9TELE|nr:hypothetical protein NHX12_014747 [Muraenolepis orangiensis]